MEDKEIKSPTNPRNPPRRASQAPTSMAKESILSPGFRSAAEMAGWDEEALLVASLVVEDTPVRDSRHKKRSNLQFKSPPTTNSNRKRRSRRRSDNLIPPLVLALDDDEQLQDAAKDSRGDVVDEEKKLSDKGSLEEEKSSSNALPCMDRLKEELSCAICLEICFEPSTTPCGHSFCMKCLKHSAAKCGKRCPKCRQLISNGRSCTVNTVLWNTIQLLFPEEVEARKNSVDATPRRSGARDQSLERSSSNTHSDSRSINTRSFTQVSRMVDRRDQNIRRRAAAVPSQSEDVALAYRLQREEFMVAFQTTREQQRNALQSTRANLRAMASRAIHIRTRSRPI
ncbi:uncharacterized protein [Typha angustifolia]|uniref:uncharacterized protein n=1 Tax=Typha angustifolia TaxID=59011 RepID=UPI003C2F127B